MADSRQVTLKPQSDAYTVLLVISLVAMITSCILLYVEYSAYPDTKPKINVAPAPQVPKDVVPLGMGSSAAPPAPAPAPPGGNPPRPGP